MYPFQKRMERYNEAAPYFQRLRLAQIKAKAVIEHQGVDACVERIFAVRQKAAVATQMLAQRDYDEISGEDQATKEMYRRMKRDMWGTYDEKYDPIGMDQLAALDELYVALKPLVKMSA